MAQFRFLFILAFFIILSTPKIFCQEKITSTFELSGNNIVLTYELQGDPAQDYEMNVNLRRSSIPVFLYEPDKLTGDVGTGKYVGGKRTVTWVLNEKEMNMFSDGEDYYFEVTASKKISGSSSWLYYVGGAAVAGGAAVLLMGKKSTTTSSGTQTSTDLPGLPGNGRPH